MPENTSSVSWVKSHLQGVSLGEVFDRRVLGFSCILAWYFIVFFSKTIHYSTRNDITSHFNSVFGWSCAGIMFVMLLAVFAPHVLNRGSSHPFWRHIATILTCAATITLVMAENYLFTQPWCSISSFLAGAGFGLFVLAWALDFNTRNVESGAIMAAASLIFASVVFAVATLAPLVVGIAITMCLPAVSDLILTQSCKVWNHNDIERNSNVSHLKGMVKHLVGFSVLSLTSSFVQMLYLNADVIINQYSYSWFPLIAAVVSTCIVGTMLFSQRILAYGSTFRFVVHVLAFLFLLLPILDLKSPVASVIALIIFCLVISLVWSALLRMADQMKLSVRLVVGIGMASQVAGALIGTFGGALLQSYVELTPRLLSAIALVCVVALFLCNAFLLSPDSLAQITGAASGTNETDEGAKKLTFKQRVAIVAGQYGLTEREAEILELTVKGRSKPRIQEMTGLAAGTVNTHLAHIYKKLDLHDKQEILDLVEHAEEPDR